MRHCTQCGAATPEDARFCPRCGAPVAATSSGDALIGKVIADRYLLVEKIGQGGSGTIYRGEHTTLRKRVAVKILHAQLSTDDTALERFRREATTVAELDNDHILQVLDFGRTEDHRLFFAMEYLEGETLTKVLERDKQLPFPRAIDILTQIAEALMEAHGLGYVHRDLRPRNVFLINKRGRTDFVKLLDFGLAKLILPDAEAKQTAMGMTFGDPRYMSPEQARGEALDRRSDIYSLGAIAFEMLTGAPPYTGSGTFEILQQHLDAPVPRVRDRRPDCPPWLDALVQRALAKKPEGRFITVLKMLESLRGQQAPATVDAAEKAEHAKLSAERPAPSPTPAAPPPVESMGPVGKPEQPAAPARSARETQALTTLAAKPAGKQQKSAKVDAVEASTAAANAAAAKVAEAKAAEAKAAEANAADAKAADAKVMEAKAAEAKSAVAAGTSASGSVEVLSQKAPEAANVPSVVVEGASGEKTVPARMPAATAGGPSTFEDRPTMEKPFAAPLPPPPATESPRRKADPTGEWFSSDSQPVPIVRGASSYDEFDDIPKKNRGPMIIAGVAGGLFLVGVIVIALLPKPAHKPMRGEVTENEAAKQAPSGAAAAPSGAVATPSGAVAQASGAGAHPSGVVTQPSGAATQPSGATTQPSGAAAQAARPTTQPSGAASASGVTAKASGERAVAAATKADEKKAAEAKPAAIASKAGGAEKSIVEKPAAKEPPARAEKVKAAPERSTRVAAATPAASGKAKKEKSVPDGFKDPFAADAPKASTPSASESAQAEFFVKLGRQKLSASELTAAAANFNKAREYDARSSEAVAGLGEVAFEQGDYNGAAVHLKQALRLSPNRSRYLVLLGQAYYKLGKAKEAVGEYKKALRVDPNNQEAQHSLEVAERKLNSGG